MNISRFLLLVQMYAHFLCFSLFLITRFYYLNYHCLCAFVINYILCTAYLLCVRSLNVIRRKPTTKFFVSRYLQYLRQQIVYSKEVTVITSETSGGWQWQDRQQSRVSRFGAWSL